MLVQTLRRCVGLGLLLGLGNTAVWAREANPQSLSITVSVYDDAGVGLETMQKAEQVSSQVFQRAGIEVQWMNCGVAGELTHIAYDCGRAVYPTHLQLRILKRSRGLKPDTFGVSYLSNEGKGCYSQIFVEPVVRLRERYSIDLATLLGHVATHEIAHLLLGTNSHAFSGIMLARWGDHELERANMGSLVFHREEIAKMTEHVAEGMRNEQLALAAAAARADRSGTD